MDIHITMDPIIAMLRPIEIRAATKTTRRGWLSLDCILVLGGIGFVATSEIVRGLSEAGFVTITVLIMPPPADYVCREARAVIAITSCVFISIL